MQAEGLQNCGRGARGGGLVNGGWKGRRRWRRKEMDVAEGYILIRTLEQSRRIDRG
jgi:hypothetical protein